MTVFVVAGAGALVAGAAAGSLWTPPRRLVAVLLAFASGSLIAALAFELFGEAVERAGIAIAAGGLLLGAVVFVAADVALDRWVGGEQATGLALATAVTLDGIPESLALGVTLAGAGSGSYVLLIAIATANFAESLSGTVQIRRDGSTREALVVWLGAAVLIGVAIVVGNAAVGGLSDRGLAAMLAFAAGAVLASLADTLMPEAFAEGGPLVALATALGFVASYALAAG